MEAISRVEALMRAPKFTSIQGNTSPNGSPYHFQT